MTYILSFIVAFGVAAIAGQILIPLLRRLKAGQSIREDGPTWHMAKQGTPTMEMCIRDRIVADWFAAQKTPPKAAAQARAGTALAGSGAEP